MNDISINLYKSSENNSLFSVRSWVNSRFANSFKLNNDCNDPLNIYDLSIEKIVILVDWIKKSYAPSRNRHSLSSYGLKHLFERSEHGFYINNGMFKGAMLLCGFAPYEGYSQNRLFSVYDTNWTYQIKFIGGVKK